MEVARIGEIANTKPIPKIPTNPKTRWIFLYMRKLLQGGLNGYPDSLRPSPRSLSRQWKPPSVGYREYGSLSV